MHNNPHISNLNKKPKMHALSDWPIHMHYKIWKCILDYSIQYINLYAGLDNWYTLVDSGVPFGLVNPKIVLWRWNWWWMRKKWKKFKIFNIFLFRVRWVKILYGGAGRKKGSGRSALLEISDLSHGLLISL